MLYARPVDLPREPFGMVFSLHNIKNISRQVGVSLILFIFCQRSNSNSQNVLNICQYFPLCAGPLSESRWSHSWRLGVEPWDVGRETPFIRSATSLMMPLLLMLVKLLLLILIVSKVNICSNIYLCRRTPVSLFCFQVLLHKYDQLLIVPTHFSRCHSSKSIDGSMGPQNTS